MTQAVVINAKIARDILTTLQELKKEVARLGEKLDVEPPYGNDAWWKWSEKKADEDIKAGRVVGPFTNARDLVEALHKETRAR